MSDLSSTNWSEVDASNNAAPPEGWPEGMMPSGVNDAARADKGGLKRWWDRANPVQTVTPSGGTWTFTTGNPLYPAAYVAGEVYTFKAASASAANDKFAVNALTPLPIYVLRTGSTTNAIQANDIVAGQRVTLVYDASAGGGGGFVLLNPKLPTYVDTSGVLQVPGAFNVAGIISATGNIQANGLLVTGAANSHGGALYLYDRVNANFWSLGSGNGYFQAAYSGSSGVQFQVDPSGNTVVSGALSVNGTGNSAIAGNLAVTGTVTANNIVLPNAGTIYSKDNGGTQQPLLLLYSNNSIYLGGGSGIGIILRGVSIETQAHFFPTNDNTFYCGEPSGFAWFAVTSYNYTTVSDRAHKEDIRELPDCLALVEALSPRRYKMNNGPDLDRGVTHWGFVAQDVEAVMSGHDFGGHVIAESGLQSLNYNELTAVLWKACQEMAARLSILEERTA